MENSQHIKAYDADPRSKNRIKYLSTKSRAKAASADVYRTFKRRLTSAATREEQVHLPDQYAKKKKKRKVHHYGQDEDGKGAMTAVLKDIDMKEGAEVESEEEEDPFVESTFASELDLTKDRNASKLFSSLYGELAPLVGSLPEILHHSKEIITHLLCYMLSPSSDDASGMCTEEMWRLDKTEKRPRFFVNLVTLDVLHLLSVLARELRHEIHAFLHKDILPRIVFDIINPPTTKHAATMNNDDVDTTNLNQRDEVEPSKVKQKVAQHTLDVTVIETAFRTLSYIFRYDATSILSEEKGSLDSLRKYYGATLAHKQEFVRRMAAETFAPLVRKMASNSLRSKHLKRVLKSLVVSSVSSSSYTNAKSHETVRKEDPSLVRSRNDAVDGISFLLFQIVRGVKGVLHSKSQDVIKMILQSLTSQQLIGSKKDEDGDRNGSMKVEEEMKGRVLCDVVSSFLFKVRGHVQSEEHFTVIWNELYFICGRTIDGVIDSLDRQTYCYSEGLGYLLQVMIDCIGHRNGHLLSTDQFGCEHVKRITNLLHRLLDKLYSQSNVELQVRILRFLCTSWKVFPEHPSFESCLRRYLPSISEIDEVDGDVNLQRDSIDTTVDPTMILVNDLLPHVSRQLASQALVPNILNIAANRKRLSNGSLSLRIIHTLATTICAGKNTGDEAESRKSVHDGDCLFDGGGYVDCRIPVQTKRTLVDLCIQEVPMLNTATDIRNDCARVTYVSRCVPFLVSIDTKDVSEDNESFVKDLCDWIIKVSKKLGAKVVDSENPDIEISLGIMLESIAQCAMQCDDRSSKKYRTIWKTLKKLKKSVNDMFRKSPSNIFVVKAYSGFVNVFKAMNDSINDDVNGTFDLLNPNLSSPCHFLRLHSLRILSSFPKIPFVTDHSELDLAGDLDEEMDGPSTGRTAGGTPYSGMCDIIETLLQLEETAVNMDTERSLTSAITRVEVLARTGKLPIIYVEAAVRHMFGIMHTKFQPIWKPSIKAIVALAYSHRDSAWPCIQYQFEAVMKQGESFGTSDFTEEDIEIDSAFILRHHVQCLSWNKTKGKNANLFQSRLNDAQSQGRVSRHQTTDDQTIYELTCSVLEGVPHLIVSNSKQVVTVFLSFLHYQYYQFHNNDPDAREIGLTNENELCMEGYRWTYDKLDRKTLQKRISSLMKIFAEVKGIHQLHQHQLLSVIFMSFLSHPDTSIARLSLKAIMGYNRNKALLPFTDTLKAMMEKDKLRNTLTMFNISKKDGEVEEHNRQQLFPVIVRVLFGRFAVRGGGNKSSKDSPAVRRAAILSFLNALDHSCGEMDYFVYMMIRVFIPPSVDMSLGECGHHDSGHIRNMINAVSNMSLANEMTKIPYQRQMGFLNLLSDVIKQFGYGVKDFIPVFTKLLFNITEASEKLRPSTSSEDLNLNDGEEDINDNTPPNQAVGKIRNLSFRRMSELFLQFETSFDFVSYGESLWSVVSPSLEYLPSSTISAEKVPSLLLLLESISSSQKLLPLLTYHPNAAKVVFQCISCASRHQVVESVMNFVENLLTEGGTTEANGKQLLEGGIEGKVGINLILSNLDVLIEQFTKRLQSSSDSSQVLTKDPRAQKAASRELSILCQISEIALVSEKDGSDHMVKMMEGLCELLVPYLSIEKKTFDNSMMDVLGILTSIFPKVNQETALSYIHDVSKLLGTNKSNPGIASLATRRKIVSCIQAITTTINDDVQPMLRALASLCASDTKLVEEHDFDQILPVLNDLGSSDMSRKNWAFFLNNGNNDTSGTDYSVTQIKLLSPLMFTCLHLLHESDGVLSRGAFQALKTLILIASDDWKRRKIDSKQSERYMLEKMIESSLLPAIKSGLKCLKADVQRSFILLLSEVARNFASHESSYLHGDMSILIRDDNQDLDFFLNFTHVQIHRRVKSLRRLRKVLNEDSIDANEDGNIEKEDSRCPFSIQTLSNILLPLCMHPIINESKIKGDGQLVLTEAIATVGAIARQLSWRKYQNIMMTVLNLLQRCEDNERFLVATLCSIIDAFHFESEMQSPSLLPSKDDRNQSEEQNPLYRQLIHTVIPKIENCLVKEKIEKGEKLKKLRCPIVLALVKLFQRLPNNILETKLHRLLSVICDALKNRESNEREAARNVMSKIATICEKYLSDIIRELAITLKEGYQLHVRAAVVHSILVALNEKQRDRSKDQCISFDVCVPGMMDILQQDIFGTADEMKTAESVKKRLVKEASGNKSFSSLEFIGRNIFFDPALQIKGISSVHALVTPLLERLRDPEVDAVTMRKVKECLNRVVVGLSHNPTAEVQKLLPFVHTIISPIVVADSADSESDSDSDESDEDEDHTNLEVTNTKRPNRTKKGKQTKSKGHVQRVMEWKVSQLDSARDEKAALEKKMKDKVELRKVIDGVNAPKMTGSHRVKVLKGSNRDLNDPASTTAVLFGLSLLHSFLKRCKQGEDSLFADPFVQILSNCIAKSKDTNITMLSLRSTQFLLRLDLPSVPKYRKTLGKSIVRLLGLSGNTHNETTSVCFKTLSILISLPIEPEDKSQLLLSKAQMGILISIIQSALTDTEHHNATFSLIKAITSTKYTSVEFYDLMERIINISVVNQQATVRQQASQIFMQYLIEYPMGKQRVEKHLKQMILNIKYEYEEGRLSAMALVNTATKKLPLPLLTEYIELMFLPLVLQLANDESQKCREAVSDCIESLFARLGIQELQSLYEYATRWSQNSDDSLQTRHLRRTSIQLFGIFAKTRTDFIKRGNKINELVTFYQQCLEKETRYIEHSGNFMEREWEMSYFCLQGLEKVINHVPTPLWSRIIDMLVFPHPWVQLTASRLISSYLSSVNPHSFNESKSQSFLNSQGCLYDIARNLCFQLNTDDDKQMKDISIHAIKNLTWLVRAMDSNPGLCFKNDTAEEQIECGSEENIESSVSKDPSRWLIVRLSNIAKKKGYLRRDVVFKCFAAFASTCETTLISRHLQLLLEPLHRAIYEVEQKESRGQIYKITNLNETSSAEAELPKEVMQLLEDKCGTEVFVNALAAVKSRATEKRLKRKQEYAAEAVHDPASFAKRKILKQQKSKQRKKQKMERHKQLRGLRH